MKFPDMDQKSFISSPASLLIFQESLLELVDAVSRWMFSGLDLLQGFDSSICDWKNKFFLFGKYHLFRIESFRVDFRCVHRLQLLKVRNQYVTLPKSHPRTMRIRGTIQVRLSFQIDGFFTDLSKLYGYTQPMNHMEY